MTKKEKKKTTIFPQRYQSIRFYSHFGCDHLESAFYCNSDPFAFRACSRFFDRNNDFPHYHHKKWCPFLLYGGNADVWQSCLISVLALPVCPFFLPQINLIVADEQISVPSAHFPISSSFHICSAPGCLGFPLLTMSTRHVCVRSKCNSDWSYPMMAETEWNVLICYNLVEMHEKKLDTQSAKPAMITVSVLHLYTTDVFGSQRS